MATDRTRKANPPGQRGRPGELTDDLLKSMLQAAQSCVSKTALAHAFGHHLTTITDWERTGDAHIAEGVDSVYAKFAAGLREKRAKAQMRALTLIQKAGDEDWKANAEFLRLCFPHEYQSRNTVTLDLNKRVEALANQIGLTNEEVLAEVALDEAE